MFFDTVPMFRIGENVDLKADLLFFSLLEAEVLKQIVKVRKNKNLFRSFCFIFATSALQLTTDMFGNMFPLKNFQRTKCTFEF